MKGLPSSGEFTLRPYRPSDCDWVACAQTAHYRANEGFDASFEDAVGQALAEIHECLGKDRTFGLILVDAQGRRRGSIFACDVGTGARLRLVFLDSTLQGRGLGHLMLATAVDSAGVAGFEKIEVSTFDAHAAACRLYARAGFAELSRTPVRAFGRAMVQIDFVCELPMRNIMSAEGRAGIQTRRPKHGSQPG